MAYWKAYAQAHDTPPDARFDALVTALETLHLLADSLEVGIEDTRADRTKEELLLAAIDDLRTDLKDARKGEETADEERASAEKRLEEYLNSAAPDAIAARKAHDLEAALEQAQAALVEESRRSAELLRRLDEIHARQEIYDRAVEAARKLVRAADGPPRVKRGSKPERVRPEGP